MKKNKSKLTDFLSKIKKPIGGILDFAGDVSGIEFLEKAGSLIKGSNDLTPEEKELALRFLSEDNKDRSAARDMQVEVVKSEESGWFAKNFIYLLSSFVVLSSTSIGFLLIFHDIPEANKRLIEMFADIYLFSGAVIVLQFFFGSSEGSKTKDKIIN